MPPPRHKEATLDTDDPAERIMRDVEHALQAMNEEGVAGGTIGPDGLRLGMPNWEERTKHQRFSERIKTHGYPLGFVKSQNATREHLVETMGERVEALGEEEREAAEQAREAMAWALDAERTLGSFNWAGEDRFPLGTVDDVADHLLAWLDHRGFRVLPKDDAEGADPPPLADRSPTVSREAPGAEGPTGNPEGTTGVTTRVGAAPEEEVDDDGEETTGGAGSDGVTCLWCEGGTIEGAYMGAAETDCPVCLGTGRMPVAALDAAALLDAATGVLDFLCDGEPHDVVVESEDLVGADLGNLSLAGARFFGCDLSGARFDGADLTGADFFDCSFAGANPEDANTLAGTTLRVTGLTPEQRAACEAKGAIIAHDEDATAKER